MCVLHMKSVCKSSKMEEEYERVKKLIIKSSKMEEEYERVKKL